MRDCKYRNYSCSLKSYRIKNGDIEIKFRYYGKGNYVYLPLEEAIKDSELLSLLSPTDTMNLTTIKIKQELKKINESQLREKIDLLAQNLEEK